MYILSFHGENLLINREKNSIKAPKIDVSLKIEHINFECLIYESQGNMDRYTRLFYGIVIGYQEDRTKTFKL
ncbi:MAG: hypothetical protein DCO96_03940 [Fluviicola sp. XM-24bin1]|nr:MAG: hypothetical protein DCO96_03940 [Fluviicola sp. XM-24bin1]